MLEPIDSHDVNAGSPGPGADPASVRGALDQFERAGHPCKSTNFYLKQFQPSRILLPSRDSSLSLSRLVLRPPAASKRFVNTGSNTRKPTLGYRQQNTCLPPGVAFRPQMRPSKNCPAIRSLRDLVLEAKSRISHHAVAPNTLGVSVCNFRQLPMILRHNSAS